MAAMYMRLCAIALAGLGAGACGEVQKVTVDAGLDEPPPIDAAPPADTSAIDAVPYVCQPTAPVGGIPENTTRPGWELSPGAQGSNDSGSAPPVLVLGDSLVFNLDVQVMANLIRFFRGTDVLVAAASGAGVVHFNKDGLIRAAGLSTLELYAAFLGTVRVTVLALGSNDARLITRERTQAGGYSIGELAHQVDVAIATARARSRCVVLVNVANHWNAAAPEVVDQINAVMRCASNARVRVADWASLSASHPEWFTSPTDIHHSEAGKAAYREFLNEAIQAAFDAGC
jgi:hypothetical protein